MADIEQPSVSEAIVGISRWISGSYPPDLDSEAHDHRRLFKWVEEGGEVKDAYSGLIGENPRKGVTHTRSDVLKELFDLAGSALGAASYWTGDTGDVMDEFRKHMLRTALRNGLIINPFLPAAPEDGEHVMSGGPTDLGGNQRCTLCGAYMGSVEWARKCRGQFAESGKMRVWAHAKWERALTDSGVEPHTHVFPDRWDYVVPEGQKVCTVAGCEHTIYD